MEYGVVNTCTPKKLPLQGLTQNGNHCKDPEKNVGVLGSPVVVDVWALGAWGGGLVIRACPAWVRVKGLKLS